MVAAGLLREDLFYRLNVFPIRLPPLRERLEDIPLLVASFLRKFGTQLNRPGLRMAPDQMALLMSYDWPGNIRELQNLIHRAAILARGNQVSVDMLIEFQNLTGGEQATAYSTERAETLEKKATERMEMAGDRILDSAAMRVFERENILKALRRANGKVFGRRGAAELLDIRPTTLIARMKRLGIDRERLE